MHVPSLFAAIVALLFVAVPAATPAQTPPEWTQFRLNNANNAVVPGTLSTTWRIVTEGPISSSPTVSGTTVFVGNNAGTLYAIEATSGTVKWRYHVNNPLMSAPLLYNGLVIIGEGNEESVGPTSTQPLYVGTGRSALIALDQATGQLRWQAALPGSGMPTPAIVKGVVIEHNGAGWIGAVDAGTGVQRYARNLHSIASMSAILPLDGDRIVTSGVMDNRVLVLHAADASPIWQTVFNPIDSGLGDCPPVSDGARIYCNYMTPVPPATYTIATQPATLHMYALDAATGLKLWDTRLETGTLPPRNEAAIPLLTPARVFAGSAVAPFMHALDTKTGAILWRTHVKGAVKGGAVMAGGTLYFGDIRGFLWALDPATGKVVGDRRMPSGFNVGSPTVIGQTLIIGSRTGSIYAVPLSTIASSHDR